ncbi:MAG TPA: DUF2937 family protein [Alphaproteobacteria bacterium]
MFRSLLDGIGAAVGAAVFSVLPSFIQQYAAALSACQTELARIIGDAAQRPDIMSPAYLAQTQARAAWCTEAAQAIDAGLGFERLIAFLQNFDPDIARATLRVFQPALQVSLDGVYFFAIGIVVGLIVVNVVAWPFRRLARRRREQAYYR